jgi:DNA-directed RNA polymerase subunit E'/Rpb7
MHYGYISKIYKIEERHGGEIIAEDPTASATFKLKFSCKLCRPLKGTTIVCEVVSINKTIIGLRNGPIHMIITEGNINLDNFVYDEKQNVCLAYAQNG